VRRNNLPTLSHRRAKRLLRRLAVLWGRPGVARIEVVVHPRLRRTLGRFSLRTMQIELSPAALSPVTLAEVLVHEAAHAALASGETKADRPHGLEWRELMALAGRSDARATKWCRRNRRTSGPDSAQGSRTIVQRIYDHWCPVCQATRIARRPVTAWRCAACAAAGLVGRLEITRRVPRLKARS